MKALVAWLTTAAIALATAAGLGWRLDRQAHEAGSVRLVVPNPVVVKAVATGQDLLLADGFWLAFVQYYGEKLVTDRKYEHLYDMLQLVTDLDPHFQAAYLFGSWVLGDDGQVDRAVALVDKGRRNNPREWIYPWQLGFVEFLYRKRYVQAADWFTASAKLGAPEISTRFAAFLYGKSDKRQLAIRTWLELYQHASDAYHKGIAKRSLQKLGVDVP